MSSPFPGMDPYLESPAFWSDFHATFINYWRETLATQLPDAYEARLGERVYLVEPAREQRKLIGPDLSVTNGGMSRRGVTSSTAPAGALTLEPVTIPLIILEEPRETYIEILHRPDRSLVAILELLSPANKEEPGRGAYLEKRNAIIRQKVHLIEVDLLRAGQRLPLQGSLPPGDYYAFIAHRANRPHCEVYSWSMRKPLPGLPIPLSDPDPDVWVDLQAVFALTYERGRYGRSLDYSASPPMSLNADDLAWVQTQTRSRSA